RDSSLSLRLFLLYPYVTPRSRPADLALEARVAKARILLADDHTLVAEAFKRLLEPEFEVVGTVGDGRALLREAPELRPDVVLVDLNMPLLNGLDASEQLKQLLPRTKIIVLTMNEDAEIAHETLHRWASGYLLKKSAGSELLKAVREVLNGAKYVTPALENQLAELISGDSRSDTAPPPPPPPPRQREVLQFVAKAPTIKEPAVFLNAATRPVPSQKSRIMKELGWKNNSALLPLATRRRLVNQACPLPAAPGVGVSLIPSRRT